jgi:hypothetical protein
MQSAPTDYSPASTAASVQGYGNQDRAFVGPSGGAP